MVHRRWRPSISRWTTWWRGTGGSPSRRGFRLGIPTMRPPRDGAGPGGVRVEIPWGAPGAGGGGRGFRRATPAISQWRILARRNVDVLLRNRMSLAIMAGSPVLVVSMFAILFRSGAFDGVTVDPTA